ncbi:tRNA lysidine(34) synthetase TilS [Acetonema longum]|uniref:tRNA lysidine(34) synthetase TilS n=1 Tax=Acetonema longum TaxID=2374 RepID=UPI0002FFB378|nr:tRNA lysidine(34) synthetase TilS [Acetonema longum]
MKQQDGKQGAGMPRNNHQADVLLGQVRQYIQQHSLLQPGDRVIVGCSGGADSLALLDILHRLRDELAIEMAAAHVDHMFRGEESAADARFVADICREYGLVCYQTAIDVPAYIRTSGLSAEDAARQLRYRYLHQVASRWGGAKIATGHHADDQAETVLMHLLRGAGSQGLSGIRPLAAGIIRPLLAANRCRIEEYCRSRQLFWRTDSSNLKTDYRRNRIRLSIMPQLTDLMQADVARQICRSAEILAGESDFIRKQAEGLWPHLVQEEDDVLLLDINRFHDLHPALKRQVIRLILEKKRGLTGISFDHVEVLIQMVDCWQVGTNYILPGGLRVKKDYRQVGFGYVGQDSTKPGLTIGIAIKVPGMTSVSQLGLTVCSELHREEPAVPKTDRMNTAVFDLQALTLPVYIRTRLPGDRFTPLGMSGSKKVKDFLIDAKIPSNKRDRAPVFYDATGRIFWLGGMRTSEYGKITAATREFLHISLHDAQEDDERQ